MSFLDWVTLVTAVWGSIAGTIALILRVRDTVKDRPQIRIKSHFEYSGGFDLHPRVSLIVGVVNIGHRPTTLDSVHATYRPHQMWKIPMWWIHGKSKKQLSSPHQRKYNQVLEEGRSCKFRFSQEIIWSDPQYDPINIVRVIVRDKAGREWKSPKQFGQQRLKEIRKAENIRSDDLQNDNRKFEIRLHDIGGELEVRARFLLNNQYHYNCETFDTLQHARRIYNSLLIKGQQYVECEIDDPFRESVA
jgi:hypothetical protein